MENTSTNAFSAEASQKWGLLAKVSWFKNKYFLAGTFFIVWMFFFDPRDWGVAFEKNAKLRELQKSEFHLTETIKETKDQLGQLKNNAQTIEKYARENYLMKKDNEDLFIVSSLDGVK